MKQSASETHPVVRAGLRRLARQWNAPTLSRTLTVVFSRSLRRSLGRATPSTGRIVLSEALRDAPPRRLLQVLCHEAAHVVAVRNAKARGEPRPRAHGPEWAELVRSAGYAPSPSVARNHPPPGTKPPTSRATRLVLHTCPVCQWRYRARRVMSRWICPECTRNGLTTFLVPSRSAPGTRAPR